MNTDSQSPFIPADEQEEDFPGRVRVFFSSIVIRTCRRFYKTVSFVSLILKSVCLDVFPRKMRRGEICLACLREKTASRSKPITS